MVVVRKLAIRPIEVAWRQRPPVVRRADGREVRAVFVAVGVVEGAGSERDLALQGCAGGRGLVAGEKRVDVGLGCLVKCQLGERRLRNYLAVELLAGHS